MTLLDQLWEEHKKRDKLDTNFTPEQVWLMEIEFRTGINIFVKAMYKSLTMEVDKDEKVC